MKIEPGDLAAVMERDPAVIDEDDAIRYHTGLHAVSMYRKSHRLWLEGKFKKARKINYKAHALTGCDIHPGATIGEGFFIDHATGVVIGETAIIGDDVTVYQGVTLGGVSIEKGKRHPTVGDRVVFGANATVLGDIVIGSDVRVGAGSVILKDVPNNSTVVGIPGQIIERDGVKIDKKNMLMHNDIPECVNGEIIRLQSEINRLSSIIEELRSSLSGAASSDPAATAEKAKNREK
ncbi:MAG: serine O-acetyltransferase [Candidatus Methanoplasma sp.]|jgi:serine O-acetyltransferase|nr:serine O-acetyltransferase [Candidatus Methanoplasma sp.]